MRLAMEGGHLIHRFTQAWEVEYIAQLGDQWVPFARLRTAEPISEIHAQPHTIRLFSGQHVRDRESMVLCPLNVSPSISGPTSSELG